jgi:tripartite-type tricarboxylate transporter receptor subunit TctC
MCKVGHAALALACALTLSPSTAPAQSWPQKSVRVILPLPPGGATDLAARLFAERLAERWRQPVVVENRQGAEGIVGVSAFVNARDNHTLLFSFAGPITITPLVQEKLPYDPASDLVPIASAADNFFAIAVSEALGTKSLDEFVQLARSRPGQLNWTATPGLPQYILAALQKSAGLELVQVPYREFAPALQDLGEGRVHVIATGLPLLSSLSKAGKARLLLVTSRERSPLAPEVPTAKEVGYPDLLFEGVVGFYGWRDMPADLSERIAADIRAVAADPAVAARLASAGTVVRAGTPAEFAAAIEEQRAKVAGIVRAKKPGQ